MALFRKDKKEEDDGREEDKNSKNPKSKDFKNLKPVNRRRRKEPKKPWGKKERFLVLAILVLTVASSAVLSVQSRDWKLPGLPRLKLPEVSLLGEKTIVLEGNTKESQRGQAAKNAFSQITKSVSGVYGLYVVDLASGYSYGVNETEIFEAASLIKLPLIVQMYKDSENGKLDLDKKYSLKNEDKLPGAGSLSSKPAGYKITYGQMIELMEKESDNTAFNICRKLIGDSNVDQGARDIGMANTKIATNETTPEDIGIFFEKLWIGEIINDADKEELLGYLTNTNYENWITQGVPSDIRVSHKYGRETNVVNDAGIVFSENPFVLVIVSKGVVGSEADEIFPSLARVVYQAQTN